MTKDLRWQQRLQNYTRALSLVEEALALGVSALSPLEKEGLMQRFEFTVELAWKTMKDYLEAEGLPLTTVTPKAVISAAWQARILDDGQVWIDMLLHRNMLAHRYDASLVDTVATAVEHIYLRPLQTFRHSMHERTTQSQ